MKVRVLKLGHSAKEIDVPSGTTVGGITFNYDLIIDRVLLERGWSKQRIYFDRIA